MLLLQCICAELWPQHQFEWKTAGKGVLGRCPRHKDNHPSFGIFLDSTGKEFWHCFSEDIGGSMIQLVMASDIPGTNSYEGANHWLIEHHFKSETEQQVKNRLRNAAMADFYKFTNDLLCNSPEAAGIRSYIANRGIVIDSLPLAAVGYYPSINKVEKWLLEKGYDEILGYDVLPSRGTAELDVPGSLLFFFKNSPFEFGRLKYRNVHKERKSSNKVIGYLDKARGEKAKYRSYFSWFMADTPGSPDDNNAVIVEGEFDAGVISTLLHMENPTSINPIYCFNGTSGFAFGVNTLVNMNRDNIFVFTDNDHAGLETVQKIAAKHQLTYVIRPKDYDNGSDPAEWGRKHSCNDFLEAYNDAIPAYSWMGSKLAQEYKQSSMEDQKRIQIELIKYASTLPPMCKEEFLKTYASDTGVSLESLLEEASLVKDETYRKCLTRDEYGVCMCTNKSKDTWERISAVILDYICDIHADLGASSVDSGISSSLIRVRISTYSNFTIVDIPLEDWSDNAKLELIIREKTSGNIFLKPKFIPFLRESCAHFQRLEHRQDSHENIYGHTGWNGEKYLMPNGYIDLDGYHELDDVKVVLPKLPAIFHKYKLDPPSANLEPNIRLIKDHLLEAFPKYITLPYLAHIFLSPLMSIFDAATPYCLWVVGQTGSRKSTLAKVMMSFFGDFTTTGGLASWISTGNALEKMSFILKDVPFVIDDYKGITANLPSIAAFIQSYGDRQGKDRLAPGLENRMTFFPRCCLISTGEDLPQGESSMLARMLVLNVNKNMMNSKHMTEVQKNICMLPAVMSKYIQFLLQKGVTSSYLASRLIERRQKFIATHGRVVDNLAMNSIAWDLASEFLGLEDLQDTYDLALEKLTRDMDAVTESEQAASLFLDGVADLLSSERGYLQGIDRDRDLTTMHSDRSVLLGYIDKDGVYLTSEAFAAVNKLYRDVHGTPLKYSRRAIYKQLLENGQILPDAKGNPTYPKNITGFPTKIRVTHLKRGLVELSAETSNSNKPAPSIFRDNGDGKDTSGKFDKDFGISPGEA